MNITEKIINNKHDIIKKWGPVILNYTKNSNLPNKPNSPMIISLCCYAEYLHINECVNLPEKLTEILGKFAYKINDFNLEIEIECYNPILDKKIFKFKDGSYSYDSANRCETEIILQTYDSEFLEWWIEIYKDPLTGEYK